MNDAGRSRKPRTPLQRSTSTKLVIMIGGQGGRTSSRLAEIGSAPKSRTYGRSRPDRSEQKALANRGRPHMERAESPGLPGENAHFSRVAPLRRSCGEGRGRRRRIASPRPVDAPSSRSRPRSRCLASVYPKCTEASRHAVTATAGLVGNARLAHIFRAVGRHRGSVS